MSLSWAGVVASFVISPFGEIVSDRLWQGFETEDAIVFVARMTPIPEDSCQKWQEALQRISVEGWETLSKPYSLEVWDPRTKEEVEGVSECEKLPCSVKLNASEIDTLKKSESRLKTYESLIKTRIQNYIKNDEKLETEFSVPIDPWEKATESQTFLKASPPKKASQLGIRKLDLVPGKMKVLRQILDRRLQIGPDEVSLWVRDIYTDHYFDSWGEVTTLSCAKGPRNSKLIQLLVLELDLLKKKDLFSRIMRPKLKGRVKEAAYGYLEDFYQKLKNTSAIRPSSKRN